MIGGGTGAGALIGGLAGGGKGALIGGLVGAGAGTAGAAFTGNKELTIPAESAASFTTKVADHHSAAGTGPVVRYHGISQQNKGGLRASLLLIERLERILAS